MNSIRIAVIKNKEEVKHEIAKEYMINHNPFFSFYVGADDRNSLINAAHFDQGGLGLPSRDYYFKRDSSSKNIRDAYKAYIAKIFILTGPVCYRSYSGVRNLYLTWKQPWQRFPNHRLN